MNEKVVCNGTWCKHNDFGYCLLEYPVCSGGVNFRKLAPHLVPMFCKSVEEETKQ